MKKLCMVYGQSEEKNKKAIEQMLKNKSIEEAYAGTEVSKENSFTTFQTRRIFSNVCVGMHVTGTRKDATQKVKELSDCFNEAEFICTDRSTDLKKTFFYKETPVLYILRGAPGSGKTTLAKKMVNDLIAEAHHEQDHYFMRETGEYEYKHEEIGNAIALCQERVIADLKLGLNVVVANNFTKAWTVEKYIKIAKDLDAGFHVIHLTRRYKNILGVPEEEVERQISMFEPMDGEIVMN